MTLHVATPYASAALTFLKLEDNVVTFRHADGDLEADVPQNARTATLERQMWDDLGAPTEVTVLVMPGNQLDDIERVYPPGDPNVVGNADLDTASGEWTPRA